MKKYLNNIINNINNNNNKIKIYGILTILILLWLVLYLIPELITLLFNTFLGILILIILSILSFIYNIKCGILITLLLIILYRFSQLSKVKESFTWDKTSANDFLLTQHTINPQKIFDIQLIQKNQASQEDLDYFNKNGKWYWSKETTDLYKKAINKNPYIKTYAEDAVNYARTIYNENAILRVMSYQTKEGQFLINGIIINEKDDLPSGFGEFPYNSGLRKKSSDTIKCNMDDSNNSFLERKSYGSNISSKVNDEELEEIIPGFTFIKKKCNPCSAINEKPDYSCPFDLKIKDKSTQVSDVWKYLWNI